MNIFLISFVLTFAFFTSAIGADNHEKTTSSEVLVAQFKEMAPANPFVIPAKLADEMCIASGLEMKDVLIQLIPVAQSFARPFISGYKVGVAALAKSGNIYLGVNLEFPGLPLNASVHGEQFVVASARNHGETEIVMMAVSAAPCGHCRQFLNEMDTQGNLQILMPDAPLKALSSFLPEAFGPKDLGVVGSLLDKPAKYPSFVHESSLVEKAMQAAFDSYSPYSDSKSGVAIRTEEGKIYTGSYLENAAFNPSLSPFQTALVALVADMRSYAEISEVALVEQIDAKISHEMPIRALLAQIAPHAQFFVEKKQNGSSMKKLELEDGVYAAALTPMHPDFSCDHKKLASHYFELIKRGCKGIALFGTTGEGASFSVAERTFALQRLISEGFDPRKIILGNGSSGISDTVQLGLEVLKQGCAALLVAPPSFYKNITDEGVVAFYREIIQRIANPNLRILLYHIPQLSGVPISLEVIETLCREFPEIVIGIKESEGNLPFTKTVLKTFPNFKVFVGKESQIIEAVYLGGAGTICGIANLYPELICSLYAQGKKENSPNPESINAVFNALNGIPFIPAAKAVMKKREGENWSVVRPPLIPLDEI